MAKAKVKPKTIDDILLQILDSYGDREPSGEKPIKLGNAVIWVPEDADIQGIEPVAVDPDDPVDDPESRRSADGNGEKEQDPWSEKLWEMEDLQPLLDKGEDVPVEVVAAAKARTAGRDAMGIQYGWQPETRADIDRLVKRLLLLDEDEQLVKAALSNELGQIKAGRQHIVDRYGASIESDASANLARGTQYAQYTRGRVQFTKSKAGWVKDDEKQLQEFLARMSPERRKELGVTAEVTYKIDLEKLKTLAETFKNENSLECVPGLRFKEGGYSWGWRKVPPGKEDASA